MENKGAANIISRSLLARDVYCACFPQRDGIDSLHGELAAVRKEYFSGGGQAVRVARERINGEEGHVRGKLSRRSFYWKKTVGRAEERAVLEEAFDQQNGTLLVRRDRRGVIVGRTFFDRDHRWLRSEYYEPWDSLNARVIFRPSTTSDLVERFDRKPGREHPVSTELFPLPYQEDRAEQSIVNDKFGLPQFIVSTGDGDFCYCPKEEAEARAHLMAELRVYGVEPSPQWDPKDSKPAPEDAAEEENAVDTFFDVSFSNMKEHAQLRPWKRSAKQETEPEPETPAAELTAEPEKPEAELEAPESTASEPEPTEAEAFEEPEPEESVEAPETQAPEEPEISPEEEPETATEAEEKPEAEATEEQKIVSVEEPEESPEPETAATTALPSSTEYAAVVRDGAIAGHIRTQQGNGLTIYDGESANGKRNGFGSYFYKDGSLCYAGFWKDDKKDGMGVSFRNADHALHVSRWQDGQPGSVVFLFDNDGSLRYGGPMKNGKKEGAGVSLRQADGSVLVEKWKDGQPAGVASLFDGDGSLLYYGGWQNGRRNGHGTEFDKSGAILFDGEWRDDQYLNGVLYKQENQPQKPASGEAEEDPNTGFDWEI